MADYEQFIDKNKCLQEYFTRFPVLLMQLVNERKVAVFSGEDILINMTLLNDYLSSAESIFEVRRIQDFIESMHIIGFSRSLVPEKNQMTTDVYRFVNQNFKRNQPVEFNLYKLAVNTNEAKNTKRLADDHNIQLIGRILQNHSREKISKLEFTHLCLEHILKKKQSLLNEKSNALEVEFKEPDYVLNNEIAGYYGNVTTDALKYCLHDYYPIYQDSKAEIPEVIAEETVEAIDLQPNVDCFDSESSPPKKRRYTKPAIAVQETFKALEQLHKLSVEMTAMEE